MWRSICTLKLCYVWCFSITKKIVYCAKCWRRTNVRNRTGQRERSVRVSKTCETHVNRTTFYTTVFGQTNVKKVYLFFTDRIMSKGRFCNRSWASQGSWRENEKNISRNTMYPEHARRIVSIEWAATTDLGRTDKSSSRRRQHVCKVSCLPRISSVAYIKMYYGNTHLLVAGVRNSEFGEWGANDYSRVPAAALGSRRTPPHNPVTDDGVKKLTFRH